MHDEFEMPPEVLKELEEDAGITRKEAPGKQQAPMPTLEQVVAAVNGIAQAIDNLHGEIVYLKGKTSFLEGRLIDALVEMRMALAPAGEKGE